MTKVVFILFAAAVFSVTTATAQTNSPALRKRPSSTTDSKAQRARTVPTAPVTPEKPLKEPAPEDEVYTVDTDLVTTPVSVLDRNGRFIPGLLKKDFKIFEDGVQQKITYFQSEEKPFTVILLIDTSPSTKYRIDQIHYAAATFLNQLRPADEVMVVAFDQRARVLTPEPTSDRAELFAAIYKSQFGTGTSLYDTVGALIDSELLKVPGRKAVVLFTDGVDTTSRRESFESTVAEAEEIDALFYPIRYNTLNDFGSSQAQLTARDLADLIAAGRLPQGAMYHVNRGQSPAEHEKGRRYLESLATNTGGRMFEADSITNLDAAFSGVAEELRRQYSVGYYPEATGEPGDRKKIKIQVSKPNAVVRAKSSYIVKQKISD
jgi:VWFA-related protein